MHTTTTTTKSSWSRNTPTKLWGKAQGYRVVPPYLWGTGSTTPTQTTKSLNAQFSSVQPLSRVQLFVTLWTAAHQASLSITNSQSLLKLISIEYMMLSNHLILCCPLFLLLSIFPSTRVFSNESHLHIRWPKFWSFSFSISPSNEY